MRSPGTLTRSRRGRLILLAGAGLLQLASAHARAADLDGFLTSPAELETIAARARDGVPPYARRVERVVARADRPWPDGGAGPRGLGTTYGTIVDGGADKCRPLGDPDAERVLLSGGSTILAKTMAWFFTGDASYARRARDLILEFADSDGYRYVAGEPDYTGANQCLLDLSWLTPLLIESALLLERWPGWKDGHRERFQGWLAREVYPPVAAISSTRVSNWGAAASFAAWSIGHYLDAVRGDAGRTGVLREVYPTSARLSPRAAKRRHRNLQLGRVDRSWRGDSRCGRRYGIQEHGGIPDELRRGSTSCEGTFLEDDDGAYAYQQLAVSVLVHHAQALRRHDRDQLYRLRLDSGVPALLQAIRFVIDNPERDGSQLRWLDWRIGTLRVANRAFRDGGLCDAIAAASGSGGIVGSSTLPFTALTHADACG